MDGKSIVDVTPQSGIPSQPFGTAVTFADIDSDGKLELYVGNYIRFDTTSIQACKRGKAMTSCPPGAYDGISGHLYKNLGNGHFADVTSTWNANLPQGKTLGAAFAQPTMNGRYPQLAIANDEVPGELFTNTGSTFKPFGQQAGIASSSVGVPHAGMGLDWGDVTSIVSIHRNLTNQLSGEDWPPETMTTMVMSMPLRLTVPANRLCYITGLECLRDGSEFGWLVMYPPVMRMVP